MAWVLTIGGTNVGAYVRPFTSMQVTNRGYHGIGTFKARFVEQTPYTLALTNEMVIALTDGATTLFGGYVRKRVRKDLNSAGTRVWEIEGQDYNVDPSEDWVPLGTPPRATAENDKARIEWLFSTFGTRGVLAVSQATVQNVLAGNLPTMDLQGQTLAQALDTICELTGAQWYVDFNHILHYFKDETAPAPFNVDVQAPNGSTTFPCRDFEYPDDTISYVNEVQVIGKGVTYTAYRGGSAPAAGTRRLHIIRDTDLLTAADCQKAGEAYLALENNRQDGKMVVWRPGLRAGQLIHIKNTQWSIDADFRIVEVSPDFKDPGGTAFYNVTFGSNPVTLSDLWNKQAGQVANAVIIANEAQGDIVAPGAPTGLSLVSVIVPQSDGTSVLALEVTLTQPTDTDLYGSYVEISSDIANPTEPDPAAWVPAWTRPTTAFIGRDVNKTLVFGLLGNTTYWARAYAADQAGNLSPFSAVVSYTTGRDLDAPDQPQSFTVTAGFKGFGARWNPSTAPDLQFNELRYAPDSTSSPGTPDTSQWVYIRAYTNALFVSGLIANQVYWVQVRAVDTSGNVVTSDVDSTPVDYQAFPEAGWVAAVSVTPTLVGATDIAANSITANMISAAGLDASVITSGLLKAGTVSANNIADGIEVWNGAKRVAKWDETGLFIGSTAVGLPSVNGIDNFAGIDYIKLTNAGLTIYKAGVAMTAITPDGVSASAINFGNLPGGHNLVRNASFELTPYGTQPVSAAWDVSADWTGSASGSHTNTTTGANSLTMASRTY